MVNKIGRRNCARGVLDWEEKLEKLAGSRENERWVEGVWKVWKAAEMGIGKK